MGHGYSCFEVEVAQITSLSPVAAARRFPSGLKVTVEVYH
jgi:hypothetical protein